MADVNDVQLSDALLAEHRTVQQLAYRCAEEIAAGLEPGVTERETTRRMRTWLDANGVEDWFHLPFAWFGDRTAFRNFRLPLQFFPTNRRLEDGMPFILDVAPVIGRATSDIGYASVLGTNAEFDRLHDHLAGHRRLILDLVKSGTPQRDIYVACDELAARSGYDNRHREYPFGVIAHRVDALPRHPVNRTVTGFGVRALLALIRSGVVGRRRGWSPLWGGGRRSDHPATPGLWAVEPHYGSGPVGAKFEELLVVTEDDAFWLDDDLPHVRRWAARQVIA
jgi:Xaa-Pro aminopeptidase